MIGFILGILSSLAGTIIWFLLQEFASVGPLLSRNPDIRGKWTGAYVENDRESVEDIEITKQFFKYVHGNFISKADGKIIVYKFSGKFIYRDTLMVEFYPDSNKVTDIGVSLFKISHDGDSGKGGSVSYNFETNSIEPREYDMKRINLK